MASHLHRRLLHRRAFGALAAGAVLALLLVARPGGATPQNVILVMGDGMGPAHVAAARAFAGAPFAFEGAPHQALMTTDSVTTAQNGSPTDSAASATAISTGRKVQNTVVSVAFPGDLAPLETLGEFFADRGKAVGLVTTSYLTDASPAAMAAHALIRIQTDAIAAEYLNGTRPELLLGGGGVGLEAGAAAAAGYTVVSDRAGLQGLDLASTPRIAGLFGSDPNGMPFEWDHAQGNDAGYDTLPFLHEMTSAALSFLANDPDGFFLFVEQENIDKAGHLANSDPDKTARDVYATLELAQTMETILAWAAGRDDTLVVLLADHETGGLEVQADNGAGQLPTVSWAHGDHTNVTVPVYAWGPNAQLVTGTIDNTDIRRITTVPEPASGALVLVGIATLAGLRAPRAASARAGR